MKNKKMNEINRKVDFSELATRIYNDNVAKGFYDEPRTDLDALQLVKSELYEAFEADRKGNFSMNSLSGKS